MDFKEYTIAKISEATELEAQQISKLVEIPPNPEMGDFAFPCFTLAKTMRKSPMVIAQELAEKLSKDDYIEKAEAKGGYLNFFFNKSEFVKDTVAKVLKSNGMWGSSDMGAGKTVLVEFSSPNIAKPFHIGHLFSTALGNSLEKIYKHLGYNTVKLNHLGDWGTQFGKLICAYKHWGNKEVIEKDPINVKQRQVLIHYLSYSNRWIQATISESLFKMFFKPDEYKKVFMTNRQRGQ